MIRVDISVEFSEQDASGFVLDLTDEEVKEVAQRLGQGDELTILAAVVKAMEFMYEGFSVERG